MKSTRCRSQRGVFGGAVDAGEIGILAEKFLAARAHFGIRFHAVDAIPMVEEEFAQQAGAGADVGNDVIGAQTAFLGEQIQQGRRVAGAVTGVIRHAIGEALFGVGKGHGKIISKSKQKPFVRRIRYGNCFRKRTSFWKNN